MAKSGSRSPMGLQEERTLICVQRLVQTASGHWNLSRSMTGETEIVLLSKFRIQFFPTDSFPEFFYLRVATLQGQKHIFGLYVSVDNPLAVHVVQSSKKLPGHVADLRPRKWRLLPAKGTKRFFLCIFEPNESYIMLLSTCFAMQMQRYLPGGQRQYRHGHHDENFEAFLVSSPYHPVLAKF